MLGIPPDLERLEDLHLIFDRFSHSIRTPLSVSMGVVNDLCSGYSLETNDLEDARTSLQSILNALNSFRDLSQPPGFSPNPQSLRDFLETNIEGSFGIPSNTLNFTLNLAESENSLPRPLDQQLLSRSIRCLLRYAVSRLNRYSQFRLDNEADLPREVFLSLTSNQEHEIFTISIPQPSTPDFISLKKSPYWRSLTMSDHSLESLGLLFSDAVFALHGAATEINVLEHSHGQSMLVLRGLFPL